VGKGQGWFVLQTAIAFKPQGFSLLAISGDQGFISS